MQRLWKRVTLCLMTVALMAGFACAQAAPTPTPAPTSTPTPGVAASSFPITITDDWDRTVTIKAAPKRIVSLGPSNTEDLFALELGDKVVGVDNFSDYPQETKNIDQVGSPFPGYNLEKIISLQPDLVLTVPGDHATQMEAQGLTVVVLQAENMDHILTNIELLGQITGAEDEARALTKKMRQRIEAVTAKTRGAPRPRVYYEIDATEPAKPWTVGPDTFIDNLLALAGGENIGAKGASGYFQMSTEQIINANPEIIILSDAQFGVTVESVAQRPGWEAIAAVNKGAIYVVEDPNLPDRPGPRIVEGLELLAKLIHPELFE